ncbi:MAG: flagellar motor protein MotB [Betaproteobacteria bacterium]|nr:flagellar motor protein MotB [Betaproteobacteria bacterium]
MSEDSERPIVIKRVKKHARGHHAGAWKIAYADFVTAMMAFFLLMWLLGSTTGGDLKGIAEYFQTPLKVALMGGSGSGDSSSLVKGGGQDLTRSTGQVMKGTIEAEKKTINLKAAEAELARKEAAKLQDLKKRIEQAIESNAALKPFRNQMLLDITTEGLRIQIVDEYNRPMFASGSAQLQSYSRDILREIGKALNDVPNRISISGHTDAQAYSGGNKGYSNWELSADRANAARRELIGGGLDETRVLRVVGLSSAVLFDFSNPLNPINRRISIIVMNRRTEEAVSKDGGTLEVDAKPDVKPDAKPDARDEATNAAAAKP